ncbi:DDE-type integrase/transposase/recombinase, partial [Trueperella pyogenes]
MTCSNATSTLIHQPQPGSQISLSTGLGKGKLYLCAIKDLYSRKIVGYAISSRMKSRLAVEALEDAMRKRGFPRGVIVHSDSKNRSA